jgi:diguanylate cyclase (GGDEF)-like protein/PAS domain S-box-containing protein
MKFANSHNETNKQLYVEQVSLLYHNAPLAYAFTLINGAFLVFVQKAYISSSVLVAWFTCLILVTVSRAGLVYLFANSQVTAENASYWKHVYLIGTGLAGITWGSTAVFLFPMESIDHQEFVICMLAGMSAGGVAVLSWRLEACLVFLLPTLLPLAIQFFILQDNELHIALGTMTLIFLGGMLSTAWAMHQSILTSLNLRFDNRELLAEVAKRQQVEESLFQEKERLQITFASLGEGVVITNADATIEYLNPMAERLSGWSSDEASRRLINEVFCSHDEQTDQVITTAVDECLQRAASFQKQAVLVARDGQRYLIDEIATPLRDRYDKVIGAVAIYRDVTKTRTLTAQLFQQANYDSLTQLPNRNLLKDRLTHAIAHAQRTHQQIAVLFLDLDRFKTVNDSLGHTAGDVLLKTVAMRLQACLRGVDTVARLGGDEFVIMLENLPHEKLAVTVARKILKALKTPFLLEGHEFVITASIGITLFPRDGEDVDTLLKHADTAMYWAKEEGRNDTKFFAQEVNQRALENLVMEQNLRHALERNELELHYQPQMDLTSGRIVGVEALLRWHHPQQGLMQPRAFIPFAEEMGLIIPIGEWVIRTACVQTKAWLNEGLPVLRVAVNLSPRQFMHQGMVDMIAQALEESSLESQYLELEITENLLMKNIERAITVMQALQSMGICLAIDDFGTGYSSLNYLKHFPVARLKIDQSFVRNITTDSNDAAIVLAVIAMAHSMQLQVVAEGVETEAQMIFLKAQHCDQIQGFYFSRPIPAAEMTALLQMNYILK